MEKMPSDPYEQKLLEVFESCDTEGRGVLDSEGLSRLCEMLHLEDGKEQLMSCLLSNDSSSRDVSISFMKFKDALVSLLGGVGNPDSIREPSPVREVSPKFVYGQKKYGRRSRPESIDQEGGGTGELIVSDGDDPFLPSNGIDFTSSELINERLSDDMCNEDDVKNSIEPCDNPKDEVTGEAELRSAWERLGVGADGFVNRNELAMVCSAVGMDSLADQVVNQVFSKLDLDGHGSIKFEDFLHLFKPSQEPPGLITDSNLNQRYSKSPALDSWENLGTGGHRLLQELNSVRLQLETVTEERDKLRNDLADANHRASILAQEVDERHARIEKSSRNKIKLLEQKHCDEIKDLKRQHVQEKEHLISSNHKLEKVISEHIELQGKLTHELSSLQKEYENLEVENKVLNDKIKEAEKVKHEMQEQIECMESLHQRVLELETSNEELSGLRVKLTVLQSEITGLRDKNDELTSQLESMATVRPPPRREGSWSSVDCGSVIGGGTKRRGKSPCGWQDSSSPRLGKVRRCCTETDLSSTSPGSFREGGYLRRLQHSESGLEADLETLRGSPTSTSLENVVVNDWSPREIGEMEIERLKSYIADLERQIDQYQMKDWDVSRVNISDDDSLQCPSLPTAKSEPTQMTNTSISNASDLISSDAEWEEEKEKGVCVATQTSEDFEVLERQCAELRSTLDRVRTEIVRLLSERKACSEENCALKLKVAQLMESQSIIPSDGIKFDSLPDLSLNISSCDDSVNLDKDSTLDSLPCDSEIISGGVVQLCHGTEAIKRSADYLNLRAESPRPDGWNFKSWPEKVNSRNFEGSERMDKTKGPSSLPDQTLLLTPPSNVKLKSGNECLIETVSNCDNLGCPKCKLFEKENRELIDRCKDLECSLDDMRVEYEKTEDYWERKLDEERRRFELDQIQTDEKYAELEAKVTEYVELFGADFGKRPALPPIEEKGFLEQQVTDLEEEFDAYKKQSEMEIAMLKEKLIELKSQRSVGLKDSSSQTLSIRSPKPLKKTRSSPGGSFQSSFGGSSGGMRKSVESKSRGELDVLSDKRQQLSHHLSNFHSNHSQSSGARLYGHREMQDLVKRLVDQEQKFNELQSAFKQHQRQSANAWEKHKSALKSILSSLRQTQDNVDHQMKTAKLHLDKLAKAEGLLKNLCAENSDLVAAFLGLEQKFKSQSESALHNSL